MATNKQVLIMCDAPSCEETITIVDGRVYEARKTARDSYGWKIKGELDTCPLHELI